MTSAIKPKMYRFTFGPWNISMGADPFGPPVRKEVAFAAKIREYKKLGFDGVQFHDDDVVPADLSPAETMKGVAKKRCAKRATGIFGTLIPNRWQTSIPRCLVSTAVIYAWSFPIGTWRRHS